MNTKVTSFSAVLIWVVTFFLPAMNLQAQWNTNTSINTQISSLPVADMQSVSTTDAKTWVAFYHQNGGNYDMRAQLFDANGYKLLGPDGILVSNQPSGTATFVFNVCVDATNNLVIAYQDQRSGPMSAVVYKISQAGTQLWGANGIVIGGGLAPYPALLSNGEIVVAWNETNSNTTNIQKITAGGTLAWTTPLSVMVGTSTTTRGQLIGNNSGKFTLVYQKRGIGISTTLYAQQYDNAGTSLYSALQICNQTTSGARYYSIAAQGDTTWFGYYASSGSRFNSFVQRINPGGTIPWGMNGSNFNPSVGPTDNYQVQTNINLSAGSPYVWSLCTFCNPSQTQYGVYVQKFLRTTGARLLTDAAKVVYPVSANTDQHAGNLALIADAPMFMSEDVNYKIYATRLDGSGNFVWPGNRIEMSSTTATLGVPKMRYGFTPDGPNRCAGVWTENRGTDYLGYAQGVSIGGLVGLDVTTQGNVPAVITTSGGTLQMVATVYPAAANQAVTWSIVSGTGQASITTGGLVTAISDGTVWAKAVSVQDITVKDSLLITLSGQIPLAPTVTTLPATNIVTTTATLNGTVTAHNATTSVSFQWGLTTAYGNTVTASPPTVNGNTPTSVSAGLSGLVLNSTYHFRCVGTNTTGTTYGGDQSFVAGCQPLVSAGTISGPPNVCIGSIGHVYSIAPLTGATGYTWTVPAGAVITLGQNTTSITVTFGSISGNVSVYATNTCSTSATSTLAVSVNPPPVPTITGSNSVCENAGTVLYSTEPGMTSYNWSVSAGGTIISGSGTYQIQVTWNLTGAQSVSVNYTGISGCAATVPTNYTVTVNPLPAAAGSIIGTSILCVGTTGVAYSVGPVADAIAYIWSLPAGATIASGINTNSITVDFAANAISGDITVAGNNLCGNGTTSPAFPVIVNAIPPTPIISQIGDSLVSSAPMGNQWYFSATPGGTGTAIPGETNQVYLPTQSGYYCSIVTLNNCSSVVSNQLYYFYVGVKDSESPKISIFPVPNDGKFLVTINSPVQTVFGIAVYNQAGEKVYESENVSVKGIQEKEIDIRRFPEGIYLIDIHKGNSRITREIVVRR